MSDNEAASVPVSTATRKQSPALRFGKAMGLVFGLSPYDAVEVQRRLDDPSVPTVKYDEKLVVAAVESISGCDGLHYSSLLRELGVRSDPYAD